MMTTMQKQDYTTSITVDASPEEVFSSINDVARWWADDIQGNTQNLNDEFTVRFGDFHTSKQKLIEVIPDKKVVWLVTESKINFVADKREWTGTKINFELKNRGKRTQIDFTHLGLVPEVECYKSCVQGWDYYIKGSLFKLLTKGKGTPGLK